MKRWRLFDPPGKSVKIDQDVTVYLMSVLDYVAADILTLVGEYVMRVGSTTVITSRDVQTAVMGDKALDALLKPLASLPKVQAGTGMGQGPDLAYEDAMKEMMQTEVKYQGSLDMLVKVRRFALNACPECTGGACLRGCLCVRAHAFGVSAGIC